MGGDEVLSNPSIVAKKTMHADETIIHLADGVDPQGLLRKLIDIGASISKFEKVEASLNDIFIDKVRGVSVREVQQ